MGKMWLDIRYEIYLNPDEIREALTKLAQNWYSLLVTRAGSVIGPKQWSLA